MEVTGQPAAHSIGYVVMRWILLTRRRAVDFCRVATALCRRSPASGSRALY
jgi:hypothetical protein